MFYGNCCVCIDTCVFIVVKIKCVNSDRISDICGKVNFITNYMYFTTPNILSKDTQILQFFIFLMEQRDLRIYRKRDLPIQKRNRRVR